MHKDKVDNVTLRDEMANLYFNAHIFSPLILSKGSEKNT